MVSHLKLQSRLYAEAQRVTEEILRGVTHDVARRIDREQLALWASSFGASADARGPTGKTARRSKRESNGGHVS
jgi:hypothetical protein